MTKIILLLVFSLLCNTAFGQQKEEAKKLIKEGITLYDKGNYQDAINQYDKALQLDQDNVFALAEKAMSMISLQRYDEAIENCRQAIKKHPGDEALKNVYVTYGTAYDDLKQTKKSLKVYNEGLKLFPDFYLLYFNKGITLSSLQKYDDAIICFQQSTAHNPYHASSQNALARLLIASEKRIPALLAFSRFLILEPQTERAKENLNLLINIMKAHVKQTGQNTIDINISPTMLKDATRKRKAKENSFASTDLILSMDAALDYDEKNRDKTAVEQFIRKFETICTSLKENQTSNYGFYWDYYVPYFLEMQDKHFIETFGYIAFATSGEPDVSPWLKSHQEDIKQFYTWSNNFAWKTK